MTEKIIYPESHNSHETMVHNEHHENAEKQRNHAVEQAKKERSEVNLENLREQAKTHAEKSSQTTVEQHKDKAPEATYGTQASLKANAYEQSLRRVQRKLTKPDRAFSKIVHNKTVDTISNIGADTIARPSGLLGGSICAFLGSLVLLYTSKHYGFRYNYLVFFLLFVGGFLLGTILELIIWSTITRKKHY